MSSGSEFTAQDTAYYYRSRLEAALGVNFTDGNAVRPLQNGEAIFPAMLEAIERAVSVIELVTFVYWRGDIAQRFANALAERAAKGVTVRLLLDAYGAKQMDAGLVAKMQSAGVELRWFRPIATWRIWRADKRTHRKILICDNTFGFTGGVGIADEWGGDARNPQEWRDNHFELQGPAITALRASFLDNWNESGAWLHDVPNALADSPHTLMPENIPLQIVNASSTVGWTDISSLVRTLVMLAKSRITLTTAYFSPDADLIDMLCQAQQRGVKVTILTGGKYCDSRLSQLAGQRYYQSLLDAGVSIYRYQKTMMHTKLLLIDDQVACFGSANINHRSLSKDEECCVTALSVELVTQLQRSIDADIANSERVSNADWHARDWHEKIRELMAGLLVEQL
ncbi:phospholipase D-like domain-containing protein [Arenicella xantha]|uniref:Cardiolipin synthase n=1 Tax=Arenicella xantha TaxID=644221 RepID=A0A395JV62_9GAMM|nr:phospholipase D-like domain-containing protein [Arenicella xantha]RBP53448.1 cardiolipin synthase [Arenicella xantha]